MLSRVVHTKLRSRQKNLFLQGKMSTRFSKLPRRRAELQIKGYLYAGRARGRTPFGVEIILLHQVVL